MRRALLFLVLAAATHSFFATESPLRQAGAAEGGARSAAARPPADDAASLELKRKQLVEKEAALKAKEEALKKLSASIDLRVNELNAAKKAIEGALVAKKKQDDDRYKKMIKIYKALKPDEAATLLNKLDEKMVIEMLNLMDQKTAVKLIPLLTQPRVLEWTRLNLAGR